MTAFFVDFRRDRIAIGSDTIGYSVGAETAPMGFVSKVTLLPRLRAAIFGRGITAIGLRAAFVLMLSPHAHRFGEAAEMLPDVLREATEEWAAEAGIDDHRDAQAYEAFFAGFDPEQGRCRLLAAYNYNDFSIEEMPATASGAAVLPALPPEFVPNLAGMSIERQAIAGLQAARQYIESDQERSRGVIIGGEVELTEITERGISTAVVGTLPGYSQLRHASAAVAARYLRGELDVDVRDGLTGKGDLRVAGGPPGAAPGASRAERRRAEKAARKAARRAA